MSGGVALQAVLSGLAQGAVYGLVAMGFTLVWRLTRVFAFAHGDLVVGSVFVAVLAVLGSTPVASAPSGFDATALVVLTIAAGALLSGLTYAVAVRPFVLAGASRSSSAVVGWVVGGIAAGLAVRELLGLAFSAQAFAIPDPLRLSSLTDSGVVDLPGGTTIPVRAFGVLAIGVVVAVVVQLLLVRGRHGLALRAVSTEPEAAALMGVSVQRMVLVAFLVAGGLAGLAGLLDAPERALTVDAGVILGLKGATAAFIGRLGSLPGALAGGLVLGVGEALAVAWDALGAAYADVLPLAVLVVVVALRPEGLGRRVAEPVE